MLEGLKLALNDIGRDNVNRSDGVIGDAFYVGCSVLSSFWLISLRW